MDTRLATALVLIAYMSDFSGRHAADMKRRKKLPRWLYIIGLVLGITFIMGFFVRLLVVGRWDLWLALGGLVLTIMSSYELFFKHRA
jgi:hypothetical protein